MPQRKIVVEFEGDVTDARALARAVFAVVAISRVADESYVRVQGFAMNPSDAWEPADLLITVTER